MLINSNRAASATALCVAGIWALCSLAVVIAPEPLRYISGAMMHLDLSQWVWDTRLDKFVTGLMAWSISSWVVVWCIATVYKRFSKGDSQ